MKLTAQELAELDAMLAAGTALPVPPPVPGLDAAPPTTLDALIRYRRQRLAR